MLDVKILGMDVICLGKVVKCLVNITDGKNRLFHIQQCASS
jgi:hypothetical protein